MKVVYFGFDVQIDCLRLLYDLGYEIVKIFTMKNDDYDSSAEICDFARCHNIPFTTEAVTKTDIESMEAEGVTLSVTAGYIYRIPISSKIYQINIHPAYLPVGRGSWPMPVSILKNVSSGVTIHKLAEGYDSGDIILQSEILPVKSENLETLTEKIKQLSVELLRKFLEDPVGLWNKAVPQTEGEYWQEPTDEDRTIDEDTEFDKARRVMRAFYGYGILYRVNGVLMKIPYGRVVPEQDESESLACKLPICGGWILAEKMEPYL